MVFRAGVDVGDGAVSETERLELVGFRKENADLKLDWVILKRRRQVQGDEFRRWSSNCNTRPSAGAPLAT